MAQQKERLLHHVKISVFCKANEKREEVLAGLNVLSPVPIKDLLVCKKEYDNERPRTTFYRAKNIELTVQETDSDEGNMTIYELFFNKMHDTSYFMKKVIAAHSAQQCKKVYDDPESIMDDSGHIKIRFDKRALIDGKIVIAERGDCYIASAAVAAYPKTYESVIAIIEKMYE